MGTPPPLPPLPPQAPPPPPTRIWPVIPATLLPPIPPPTNRLPVMVGKLGVIRWIIPPPPPPSSIRNAYSLFFHEKYEPKIMYKKGRF